MKIKGKYSESTILYAILLGAGLLAAIIVFIIVFNATGGGQATGQPSSTTTTPITTPSDPNVYNPDEDTANEMKDAATKLLSDNYKVLRLFYTKGMAHKDEPYGNIPEDGYYTVDSEEYTSLDQLFEIVDSTYTKEQADVVKTNSLGYGAIYKMREDGTLGIIMNFTPMEYTRSWDNPVFTISPISDTECTIEITIHEKETTEEVKLTSTMIKDSDSWKLKAVVF